MAQAVRSRDMGRTLWFGFGLLTLLLAMLGVTAVARLQSIGEEVQAQARFSRPRSAATLELEFNLLDYGMGVRQALAGDPQALLYVTENAADVERWLAEYRVLAQTDRQRELATRFAVQWRELLALGRELLANKGQASEARLELFATLRRELESVVDREMQPEALEAYGNGQAALLLDLQNTEVLILALLVVGVLTAMAVSRMVGRAVLGHEQALRESEQKFSTVFHAAPIAQSLAALSDGALVDVNEAWLQLSGFARKDEVVGKTPGELGLITDAEARERILDELRRSGSVHGAEIAARSRDGVPLALLMDMRPIEIGGRTIILTTNVDIAGRKKTDEALRESRALLQAVIDGLPDAVFLKDARSRIIVANPATLRILGKSLDEVIGRDDSEHYADPDVGRAIMENDRRIMESEATEMVEEVGLTPEGYRTFLSTKTPWRDAEGRVIGLLGITRDITERKKAEEGLRRSREDLNRAQEVGQIGSWRLDTRLNVLTWSDENYRIFGVAPGAPLTYETFLGIVHPDDRAYVDARWTAGLRGEPYDLEHRIVADGGVKWVREKAYLEFDAAGGLLGGFGITQDITERKNAVEALGQSEAKYHNLFENMTEEVHFWELVRDDQGRIRTWRLVDANPPAVKTWGRSAIDEIRGKTADEIFGPGATEHYRPVVEKIMAEGVPFSFEDYFPNLDKHFRFTSVPLGEYFITTGADITGIKKTELALRESRDYLQKLFDNANAPIICWDPKRAITRFNPAFEQLTGYSAGEVVGRDLSLLFPDGTRDHSLAMIERALTQRWEVVEIPIRRKNGDTRVALWNSANVYAEDGTTVLATIAQGQDITARKLAEEALKDSEARYRLVFEMANEGIWVTDGTWKTVLVNQRMADMLGYSVDELQGRVPAELLQADQEPSVLKARGDLAAGSTINREFKFRRKDGSDLWVISNAAPVKDPEGRLIRTVSMLTDITERKAAEDAIRASEAKLRGVLDATQESIWVFDPDGIVLLANAVGLARMRREARDIIGKRMMEILPRDLGRSRMERLREVVGSARPAEFEDERAGLLFHHSFCPALDSAGRVMFVVSFSQDITERKKTEALRLALAEQDRVRLGAAVEQASDSVVMFDLDGTIRYVNAAFESVNRLPRDDAVGHSYFDLLAGDPSAAALRKAIGQGLAWHGPVIRTLPEGRTIELEVMYSPAKDPAGATVGGLVTEADVTERNALQQQIRQAQKMEALGTLAGGITHDFNNILGTIVINTELALLDLDPSDPARRPLPVVLQAANRGKELVKQIITFSRQRAWERKPVEIAPVVREGLGLLRSTLPKDIVLRETIDDGSGIVLADPSHIHQILVNLCQNAALAMRDRGERQLEVDLEPVEADAAMAVRHPDVKPGLYIRLTVADTGCGMTPEIMERIFEPFYTTRERGSGSGLGLSVVHGIVKSYGGAITVRSRPGQGSVFDIYLPRLGEDVLPVGAEPAPQPVRGRARILVVEDEEAQRTSLALGLERLGYLVTAEPEGRSALAAFRKDPGAFDLVITDQIMPRMSGLELAAELMKVRPEVPVILCTGFSEKVDNGTVGSFGIRELAMKPFTITEISQLIRKALGKGDQAG